MKKRILKTPYDYETFQFRLTKAQKELLNDQIEEVVELYNKKKDDDEKAFRKNTVIMEALARGLDLMRRGKGK